jgi:hypothetical protein
MIQPIRDRSGFQARFAVLIAVLTGLLLLGFSSRGEVRIFVQDSNGVALVEYQCTAGELVRAFALDVSVDRGQILGVSGFFRGDSKTGATGYGIFPASFRDHINVGTGTNIDWSTSGYTPLAVPADSPGDTLPGLNSSGVTLELGALWDPTVPAAAPGPAGTLCALTLSQPAQVSVAANVSRGGVVSAFPDLVITPVFIGTPVGPWITSAIIQNGLMNVLFNGGELQSATSVLGPWNDTGDVSGNHSESFGTNRTRFYRVRSP